MYIYTIEQNGLKQDILCYFWPVWGKKRLVPLHPNQPFSLKVRKLTLQRYNLSERWFISFVCTLKKKLISSFRSHVQHSRWSCWYPWFEYKADMWMSQTTYWHIYTGEWSNTKNHVQNSWRCWFKLMFREQMLKLKTYLPPTAKSEMA